MSLKYSWDYFQNLYSKVYDSNCLLTEMYLHVPADVIKTLNGIDAGFYFYIYTSLKNTHKSINIMETP